MSSRGDFVDYVRAAAIVLGALLLQRAIWPYIQPSPFLLITLAVLLAGWRGGRGPGLLAVAVAAIGTDILFLPPTGQLSLAVRDLLTVGLFIVVGVFTTWLNVARERAVLSTAEHQEWLQTTLRSIADAVIATDRTGRVRFVNGVAENLTGWPAAEAVGRPLADVFQPVEEGTGGPLISPVEQVLREGRPVALVGPTAVTSRSGQRFVLETSAAPIRRQGGRLLGAVLVFRDATQRWHERQRRLLLAEANRVTLASFLEYEAMLSQLAELAVPKFADWCAVHLLEGDGSIRMLAAAHAEEGKATFTTELDRRFPQQPSFPVGVANVIRTGKPEWTPAVSDELLAKMTQGEEHLRLLHGLGLRSYIIAPLRAHDRTLGAIFFATAASGRRYEEVDVQFANELAARAGMGLENARLYAEAQEAIRVRDEFLSVASHELKTPITTLQLQLDGLNRALANTLRTEARLAKRLETANRQTIRLSGLVENLLQVSRITTGRLELNREEVDLGQLAADAADRFESAARSAGCQLTVIAPPEPVVGHWDRLRIEQVLANLLSNALKYGAGKPVQVSVAEAEGVARLTVADSGIGIAPADIDRIFGRFERAVSMRHYGGLGLGLFIARQIVEAHGGEIGVCSEPGQGSEFTVVLPTGLVRAPSRTESLTH